MLGYADLLKDFNLYDYQDEIVQRLLSNNTYALFVEMGLGKTLMALSAVVLRRYFNGVQRVLVVCPKTVSDSWLKDIQKLKYVRAFYSIDVKNLTGAKKEEAQKIMNDLGRLKYDIVIDIINFEKIAGIEHFPQYDMLIVDESTRIKNPTAKRTIAILEKLKSIPFRLVLTGSPVVRDINDLWSQLYLVDAVLRDYGSFKKAVKQNKEQWINYANSNIVSLRKEDLEKAGIFKFPQKVYKVLNFELSPEAKALYAKVEELLRKSIIIEDKRKVLAHILQAQMVTSGINPFNKKEIKDNRKKKLLGAILKSGLYKPPYLIWATFIRDIHLVHNYLTSLGFKGVYLYGATPDKQRKKIIKDFQDGKYDFLVAHPVVLGIGVTLVTSNVCIYYSNSFRFEDRVQSEDRIHRVNQKADKCYYIDLVAKDTIDEVILENLKAKRSLSSMSVEAIREKLLKK